ncbi:hypothetical protein J4218_05015 [Candidatus Pacearchaeota archaeon]|nr:hypothetical protein [Candidatus Pacearchaeota archaeon]
MPIDITGIYFFMPVFSFLFVFVVVYAILAKTKVLGDQKVNLLVSFVMAIIFMNFSSMQLYVETMLPWFVIFIVCLFLALVVIAFSTKEVDKIMKPAFAWVMVAILVVIFLISAIKVFNPVFHPEYGVVSGNSPQIISQIRAMFDSSTSGTILLLIVAAVVTWVLVRKGKS